MNGRFHHAGIVVPDLEKGIAFYRRLLGLDEQFRFEWDQSQTRVEDVIDLKDSAAKAAMLGGKNFHIELFEYGAPRQRGDPAERRPCDPGIRHIAFEFDDIESACQLFVEAGGSMHHQPVRLGDTWAIYGRDPFGNIVELMQPIHRD